VIKHFPVSELRETLGVWTCPRGDEAGALLDLQDTAQDWIDRVKEGNLWRREAQSENGLCCNSAELKLLDSCLRKLNFELLPIGGVTQTAAPAVIRDADRGFHGVGCPNLDIECLAFSRTGGKTAYAFWLLVECRTQMQVAFSQLVLALSDQQFQESCDRGRDSEQ
jgi:hypothetical protein